MKLIELLETVVDAEKTFKDKKKSDFHKKIQAVAHDIPAVFAKQKELESEMTSRLKQLVVKSNKDFIKHKLELASVAKEYRNDTLVLDYFTFADVDNEPKHYQTVVDFFKKHK